jgi:hypothetical protein
MLAPPGVGGGRRIGTVRDQVEAERAGRLEGPLHDEPPTVRLRTSPAWWPMRRVAMLDLLHGGHLHLLRPLWSLLCGQGGVPASAGMQDVALLRTSSRCDRAVGARDAADAARA